MGKVLHGNFTVKEVNRSQTADRNNLVNEATDSVLNNARDLVVNCLQPIRDHYGKCYSPSSWYRSSALERIVCSRSYEAWAFKNGYRLKHERDAAFAWQEYIKLKSHPTGSAADIEVPGVSNDDLFKWCQENLEFDQLIREFAKPGDPESGWVHISYNKNKNRNEAFAI